MYTSIYLWPKLIQRNTIAATYLLVVINRGFQHILTFIPTASYGWLLTEDRVIIVARSRYKQFPSPDGLLLAFIHQSAYTICISLTHCGRDKMTAISQTTYSKVFPWMKMYGFRLTFHWSLFLLSVKQYSSIGSDNGLVPTRWQAIIWTNDV